MKQQLIKMNKMNNKITKTFTKLPKQTLKFKQKHENIQKLIHTINKN